MSLRRYLNDNGINDIFQSAYRPNHSTETALVKLSNDIELSLGTGKKVVLCLLDLSADHITSTQMIHRWMLNATKMIHHLHMQLYMPV